ncbi:hypothetical protein [Nocardia barduliensis]|uniref:hypothetical protein n=1 Tax=Nocardia barduliensis TaxID=2736643 RepID=UPI0015733C32|nr:hypothetical protein [Nocardia barduliensis]
MTTLTAGAGEYARSSAYVATIGWLVPMKVTKNQMSQVRIDWNVEVPMRGRDDRTLGRSPPFGPASSSRDDETRQAGRR